MQNGEGSSTMFPLHKHAIPQLPNVIRAPNYLFRTEQMVIS